MAKKTLFVGINKYKYVMAALIIYKDTFFKQNGRST